MRDINYVYQYHVYNDHVDMIVSATKASYDHVLFLARRYCKDFYDYSEEQLEDLKCELVVKFLAESVINMKLLKYNNITGGQDE